MDNAWRDELEACLIKKFGVQKGQALFSKYHKAFLTSYAEECTVQMALRDILRFENLSQKKSFSIYLYEIKEERGIALHLRLYQYSKPLPLSDILPILENLGLRTLTEHPYEVSLKKTHGWISDFAVLPVIKKTWDIKKIKPLFKEVFLQIFLGRSENDAMNKLVLGAMLSYSEITILRAYAKYLAQAGFRFSLSYIEETVSNHPQLSKNLVKFFKARFSLKKYKNLLKKLDNKILEELDAIDVLAEDRIMRQIYYLMLATVRTNYFQKNHKNHKDYLALKFYSKAIPDLPKPCPLYEIFVYSARFEGIHLRSSAVSRGGIRWSDRREDLRTEILGLMKAQRVKNAVIVPGGAKGGFVLKKNRFSEGEVVHCYKLFIRSLLDLTDNIQKGEMIHPVNVFCIDDFDPYLVVAADKGTGAFSDIANSIAKEYDFWLGDAFASGGMTGYNHKEMGITARGAFESIRRHFRECDINIDQDEFTVIGIGDMGGDVFGNGMLYSKNIKLIAAFNGKDIFIDPNPDPQKSYRERKRLFQSKNSSWQNYNRELISKGGGVFSRLTKSIALTPEIRNVLKIDATSLSPDELITAILKAPCDLLYNGGIGTFVKSSNEKNDDVLDKTNDFCRINANELRVKVVGEGGNLGFTQLARVEFSLLGGHINTDFIDNSGGVDCSDHEVNIKILLDKAETLKKITNKERNALLSKMKDEVAELVLRDNYNQALTLSLSRERSMTNTGLYENFIKMLEASNDIDRALEFLPDAKTILERKAANQGLTSPEIAILLSYSKIHVKNEILKSGIPEDKFFIRELESEFPKTLHRKNFQSLMRTHRLYREIIATQLSNKIVNEMGVTFVYRVQDELAATVSEVIRAYVISSKIFESEEMEHLIESFNFKVSAKLQYDLLHHTRHLINLSTRWFLRNPKYANQDIEKTIKYFYDPIKKLEPIVPDLVSGNTKEYLKTLTEQFIHAGIPKEAAKRIATYRALYILLNVIDVASQYKFEMFKTAKMYYDIGTRFNFVWFRDHISVDVREGHWYNLARLTLRDELDVLQKLLTIIILQSNKKENNVTKLIDDWIKNHPRPVARWESMVDMILGNPNIDYSMFFIVLRELYEHISPV